MCSGITPGWAKLYIIQLCISKNVASKLIKTTFLVDGPQTLRRYLLWFIGGDLPQWDERPLPPSLVAYASGDVRSLHRLRAAVTSMAAPVPGLAATGFGLHFMCVMVLNKPSCVFLAHNRSFH